MKIDQAILQNQNKLILNQNDKIVMQTYDNFYQELKNYIFNNKELKTFKKIKDELEFRHFRIDQNIDLEVDISDLNKEMKGEFDLLTTHFFNKDIKCVAEFKIITKKQKYDYSKAYGKQIQRQLFALRKLYKNNFRYMHIVFNLETKKINTTFISGEWLQYVIEQEKIDNFKNNDHQSIKVTIYNIVREKMKQNLTQQDIKKIFEIVENKNNLYNQKYENLTKFLWSKNIHGMDRIKIIKRFLGEK